MASSRRGGLAWFTAMLLAAVPLALHAEQLVSQVVRFEGPAQQVLAMHGFDARRGTLVRVRLEISGVASGAVGHYGARGKRFDYSGKFVVAETANMDPRGIVATARARGVDSAPPSPDSLAAVDWHVAIYGSLQYTTGLERFVGGGPVYVLYVAEQSRLTILGANAAPVNLPVDDSTLRARATLTYHYQPPPGG